MSKRSLLSAGAVALGVLSIASAALAGPPGHPFERKPVPAPAAPQAQGQAQATTCDCMMMKGAAAMRDQCMAMMSLPRAPSQPGSAG
jgi:hypothetical protein